MSEGPDDSPNPDHPEADQILRDILDTFHPGHNISPSGELYRVIERHHNRYPDAASRRAFLERMASEQDATRRRSSPRNTGDQSPLFVLPPPPPPAPVHPQSSFRERFSSRSARRGRSRALGDRHSARPTGDSEEPSAVNSLMNLQYAGRQLAAASSSLRALLDTPVPSISLPPLAPPSASEDMDYPGDTSQNHRVKRRKLDNNSVEPDFTGFRYGKYGQVEPGKLKMEIVSCDGGIFQEHSGGNYAAENILRNDDTVYCTKSNRCNLVLRHQGATVFSLKELIIKAPHSGYTAPVQEGMVFVSMTSDDLLTRTAQYQIQYLPSPGRSASRDRRADLPSIMSIRHNHDGSAQARVGRLYEIGVQDEECDVRTAQIPPDFITNTSQFQVTTYCSDSEDEGPNRRRFGQSNRAPHFFPISDDEGDSDDSQENYLMNERGVSGQRIPGIRRRETASNITLAEAVEASQIATQEAVQAVGGELMVPHARFFIERDKSKCTVRFDPPVSGRFILLKMWSPHQSPSGNIDVQSVVAKGFAGPRFFPDVQFR